MDVDRIVVNILANSTQYESTLDRMNTKIWAVTRRMETAGQKLGLPVEQIARDVDAIIREYHRLESAAHRTLTRAALSNLVGPNSTRAATSDEMAWMRAMTGRGSPHAAAATVAANEQQLATMRQLLGVGPGSVGATPEQLAYLRSVRTQGALPALGPTRAASPAELIALRAAQGQTMLFPGTVDVGGRRITMEQYWANQNQFRPGVFGREFTADRRRIAASGARGDLTRGGGGEVDTGDPAGMRWNWIPSILGGAVGRLMGGRLGGLGGMIGGGLGGPVGAVAGVGIGTALHTGFRVAEAAAHGVLAVVHKIGEATVWAATQAMTLGIEYQKTETMLQVMSGSKERGTGLYREIQQLGISTPYTTRSLTKRAGTLLGYGAQADDMIPILDRIGDIAAGDEEKLQRLTLAYGQVLSHGRLMGQEVRQFAEAGVGLEDFAKTAGVTAGELRDMMRTGSVGADVMIRTINRLTNQGGRFFGMSAEQMKTVGGAWSNLVERLEIGAGRFGVAFFQKFDIAGRINRLADSLANLESYTGPFLNWLGRLEKVASGPIEGFIRSIITDLARIPGEIFGGQLPSIEAIGPSLESGIRQAAIAFGQLHVVIKSTIQTASDLYGVFLSLASIGWNTSGVGFVYEHSGIPQLAERGLIPSPTQGGLPRAYEGLQATAAFLEEGSVGWQRHKMNIAEKEWFTPERVGTEFRQEKLKRVRRMGSHFNPMDEEFIKDISEPELKDVAKFEDWVRRAWAEGAAGKFAQIGMRAYFSTFGSARREIPFKTPPVVDHDAVDFREKFLDKFKEGLTPERHFARQVDLINRSFGGPGTGDLLKTLGMGLQGAGGQSLRKFGLPNFIENVGQGGRLGWRMVDNEMFWLREKGALPPGMAGIIGGALQGVGVGLTQMRGAALGEELDKISKHYGDRFENRLSAPMARGSAEAQDVINRALTQQLTVEEKMLAALDAMKEDAKEQKEIAAKQLAIFEQWRKEQPEQGPMPREIAGGG